MLSTLFIIIKKKVTKNFNNNTIKQELVQVIPTLVYDNDDLVLPKILQAVSENIGKSGVYR
jgi:hypothetical protein